jgi:hypothetical protein
MHEAVEGTVAIGYNVGMDELDGETPPPPRQPMAPPAALTGCVIACGFVLLPIILYVGAFVYLVADERGGWGVTKVISSHQWTSDTFHVVYRPLIQVYRLCVGVG